MALPDVPLRVEVVSADGLIWEGDAASVVARTTEGDVGILPNHEPFLGVLVPSAAEVLAAEGGSREIVAVADGFIAVADNRVSLLSSYAKMAREISLPEAERELYAAQKAMQQGDIDNITVQHYHRASAQVKAAAKAAEKH